MMLRKAGIPSASEARKMMAHDTLVDAACLYIGGAITHRATNEVGRYDLTSLEVRNLREHLGKDLSHDAFMALLIRVSDVFKELGYNCSPIPNNNVALLSIDWMQYDKTS